ncbi:MAG: hypothetical protein A4E72_02393 [Syntrophus sp. PtaU1.Bin208]|nr:MAG: hypothetical protein A4E72_02393 [Syntrophus sp. PtaU1.Bin208]
MHEAIIACYRDLLKKGFEHAGFLKEASIFLRNFGEVSPVCGNTDDFMYLYLNVVDNVISEIRYQCICDPASNVAIEIFCSLVEGKTLSEAAMVKEEAFLQFLDCEDEGMREKAGFLLDLLNEGIQTYQAQRS